MSDLDIFSDSPLDPILDTEKASTPKDSKLKEEQDFVTPVSQFDKTRGATEGDLREHKSAQVLDHPLGSVKIKHLEAPLRTLLENILQGDDGNIYISSNATIDGTLDITSSATLGGRLSITGTTQPLRLYSSQSGNNAGNYMSFYESGETRLGFIGYGSSGNDILYIRNETTGGLVSIGDNLSVVSDATIGGRLTIQATGMHYITSNPANFVNADPRNHTDGAPFLHRYRKSSSGYQIYRENWWDGSEYSEIGLNASGFYMNDSLSVTSNATIGGHLAVDGASPSSSYSINAQGSSSYGIRAHGSVMGGMFQDSGGTSTVYCAYMGWGINTSQYIRGRFVTQNESSSPNPNGSICFKNGDHDMYFKKFNGGWAEVDASSRSAW